MALRLDQFIKANIQPILAEWETFAKTRIPAASTMSLVQLRDHAKEMLIAIAQDMAQPQTEPQRADKARGLVKTSDATATAAADHGRIRHLSGFDLNQVASEFRALRAAVLRLWGSQKGIELDARDVEYVTRFNESVDQAVAESIENYSGKIDESRDTFLAVLGHDLRGPLSTLRNCVQLQAMASQSDASRDRIFQIAKRSVASMDEMITNLLEYTRTRLGRGIEVLPEPGDLGKLCRESVEEARTAHPKSLFECECSGDLAFNFDSPRIHQVLINLLNNAVQHGDSSSPVSLTVRNEGQHASVMVSNSGRPIPPDSLQVIFNPLVQVPLSESQPDERPPTSLGLGLFISREIINAHDGTIQVRSDESGTAFTFRLPIVQTSSV